MFEWKLGIERPSLAYAAKTTSRQPIFAVDIPYPLLKLWQEYMVIQSSRKQMRIVGQIRIHQNLIMLISLNFLYLEMSLPSQMINVSDMKSMNPSERLLERRNRHTTMQREGGRKRMELDASSKRFHVLREW